MQKKVHGRSWKNANPHIEAGERGHRLNEIVGAQCMPIHYRYDDAARRLLTRCEGQLTLQEVISHFRELSRSTRLHPGSDVVVDVTFQTNVPGPENLASAASVL